MFNILVLYKFQSIWSLKYFSSFPNIILLTFSYVILYTLKSKFSIAKLLSPNSYTKFNYFTTFEYLNYFLIFSIKTNSSMDIVIHSALLIFPSYKNKK